MLHTHTNECEKETPTIAMHGFYGFDERLERPKFENLYLLSYKHDGTHTHTDANHSVRNSRPEHTLVLSTE